MVKTILAFNGAALMGCAIFFSKDNNTVITALLLVLPFLDANWRSHVFDRKVFKNIKFYAPVTLLVICYLTLFIIQADLDYVTTAISVIFLIALPEEWFFRYYYLQQLEIGGRRAWVNNIICSLLFTVVHIPTQGLAGLAVFFPSLVFGYVYQRSRSLIIIVLLHGLANLLYVMYFQHQFESLINIVSLLVRS